MSTLYKTRTALLPFVLVVSLINHIECQPLQGIENICQWEKRMEQKVAGIWLTWGEWRKCMANFSCDGLRTRSRTCLIVAPLSGSSDCPGGKTEAESCVLEPCHLSVAPFKANEAVGGTGGVPFSDYNLWNKKSVTGIRMQCGLLLVTIQLKYGDIWGPVRGGSSGGCNPVFDAKYNLSYEFGAEEYIVAINATHKSYINSVTLQTNKRILRKCGTSFGPTVKNIKGNRMLYISGRHGCYIDTLNLHWAA